MKCSEIYINYATWEFVKSKIKLFRIRLRFNFDIDDINLCIKHFLVILKIGGIYMISKTSWNRIIYVATGLVILVVLIIVFYIIPQVKADTSPTATPERAVPAFWVIVLTQLLTTAALIYSIMFSHREGHFENGFLVTAGVFLILLGLILIDAASASLSMPDLSSTSIFLFICIGFDLIAGMLSLIARYFRGHLLLEK